MGEQPNIQKLKAQLLLTGLQRKDNPLFQVINELVIAVSQSIGVTGETITAAVSSIPWGVITGTPTTLAGYGITDAEPYLGLPGSSGYVLTSTILGLRSWIAQAVSVSAAQISARVHFQV